jgi:hypothetical protein
MWSVKPFYVRQQEKKEQEEEQEKKEAALDYGYEAKKGHLTHHT